MSQLKSAQDVLDDINKKLDANSQAIAALVTEDATVLQLVTDLVNKGAGNITEADLTHLQEKVSAQTSALQGVKDGLDAAVAAGQTPTA